MQQVVFHKKILAFLAAYKFFMNTSYLLLKGFYTFNEQSYLYFLIFNQNYVLSRNVANLLNIFSLIVFGVKYR